MSVACYDPFGNPVDETFSVSCSDVGLNASPSFYYVSIGLDNQAQNGFQLGMAKGHVTGDSRWNQSGTVSRPDGSPPGVFYADLPEVTAGALSNAQVPASEIWDITGAPTRRWGSRG